MAEPGDRVVSDQRLRNAAVKLRGMSATAEPWINQVVAERLAELLEAIERLPQPLHVDVLQIVVDARYLARAVNACEECRNHWTTWHYAGDLRAAGLIDEPGTAPLPGDPFGMPACDERGPHLDWRD